MIRDLAGLHILYTLGVTGKQVAAPQLITNQLHLQTT